MTSTNNNKPEERAFLKRKVLASCIINMSLSDSKFGLTKFEKLLHLADYYVIKRNLGQCYYKKPAGPYDNRFTKVYFEQTTKSKWYHQSGNGDFNRIVAGEKQEKSTGVYDFFTDEELEKLKNLVATFSSSNYEQPEIVSTMFAVWNNRIIKQEPISDELLKQDFLAWDEGKAKYKDRLDKALEWMKKEEMIPDGWGKVIEEAKKKK